jgi:hypothetical protein
MISSHAIAQLFQDPDLDAQQGQTRDRVVEAARAYAKVLAEEVPQSPALERALSYALLSMLAGVHGITVSL